MDLEGIVSDCACFWSAETDLGEPSYGDYEQIAHLLPARSNVGGIVKKGANLPAPQIPTSLLDVKLNVVFSFNIKHNPTL